MIKHFSTSLIALCALSSCRVQEESSTVRSLEKASRESDNDGASIYSMYCVPCHNVQGQGDLGPNLTDRYWIYGFDQQDVARVISNGTDNGMPEHRSKLKTEEIEAVAQYVLDMNFMKGKQPQGNFQEP